MNINTLINKKTHFDFSIIFLILICYITSLNKMKKLVLLLFAVNLILTGCKKEKGENNDKANLAGLIKSISSNGTSIVEFSYNNNAKLITKTIHQGTTEVIVKYEYSGNKLSSETAKQNNSIVWQYTYEYNNSNLLTRVNLGGVTDTYWEMSYDSNGKIQEAVQYISGGESKKQEYSYNGDNLVEAALFFRFGSIWELQERYEFEYDNLNNPYYALHLPFTEEISEFAGLVSPNNITYETRYDENNNVIYEFQYQITYNTDHFPIHIVELSSQETYDIAYY